MPTSSRSVLQANWGLRGGEKTAEKIHESVTFRPALVPSLLIINPFCVLPTLHCLSRKVRLRKIRRTRQNERLDLWQTVQSVLAEAQMVFNDLLGRQAKPLGDGDVVVGG